MNQPAKTPREAFLSELRERTTAHLHALSRESGETLGRFIALPDLGPRMYHRLVEEFQMDGAQEIAACFVDLFAGELDSGTVMLTEREYHGLRFLRDEFSRELPDGPAADLDDLIRTLAKTGN